MRDTIYRDDAIKVINLRARIPHDVASAYYASMAINAVRSVPSADRPRGKWIPCSEREPNEFEDVLVLLSDGTSDVLQLTDYLDIWGNVKWCHTANYGMGYSVSGNNVVAWMPLPKPCERSRR